MIWPTLIWQAVRLVDEALADLLDYTFALTTAHEEKVKNHALRRRSSSSSSAHDFEHAAGGDRSHHRESIVERKPSGDGAATGRGARMNRSRSIKNLYSGHSPRASHTSSSGELMNGHHALHEPPELSEEEKAAGKPG